jgi:hypothetical protein
VTGEPTIFIAKTLSLEPVQSNSGHALTSSYLRPTYYHSSFYVCVSWLAQLTQLLAAECKTKESKLDTCLGMRIHIHFCVPNISREFPAHVQWVVG